jgi:uncharacterized Ntn-hydrolase superfamily protein
MTYSIVARDPETGAFGVAVQSHWPFVGAGIAWAKAGVGALASQAFADASYGPLGLELLHAGKSPDEVLRALSSIDEDASQRQVGIVDTEGRAAVLTGPRCIREAGHVVGDGFTVQANMMERSTVWDAMASAYLASTGEFAFRLVDALDAGEREGGDIRGRQSGALLLVGPNAQAWEETTIRVDDSEEPLVELRRLLRLERAYGLMGRAEDLGQAGDAAGALKAFGEALELAPGNEEIRFWLAVGLATAGRTGEARSQMASLVAERPQWAELLRRLPAAGLLQDDPELLRAIDPDA